MDTTIWGIIGIIVTLATFVIVYWRTTSARQERGKQAHRDIVVVLTRILAQGQDSLELPIVESLLKSKAREHDVNLSLVDELPKITEDLITKFTESEFITSEARSKLIEKVMLLREKFQRKEPRLEEAVAEYQQPARLDRYRYRRTVVLSTMAALLAGTIIFVIAYTLNSEITREFPISVVLTTVLGLIAALGTYIFEYGQTKRKEAERSLYLNKVFERIVIEALHEIAPKASVESDVKIVRGDYHAEADFVIKVNNAVVPVEIKTGTVKHETILSIVDAMRLLKSKRGHPHYFL